MRNLLVVALFVTFAVTAWARPDEEHYSSELESIDVKEVFGSPRLVDSYYNCFANKGTCVPAAKKIKEVLPDALQNKCAKCTEIQKKKVFEVIKALAKDHPEKYSALEKIYDKERKFRSDFAKELKDEGITLPE